MEEQAVNDYRTHAQETHVRLEPAFGHVDMERVPQRVDALVRPRRDDDAAVAVGRDELIEGALEHALDGRQPALLAEAVE